MRLCVSLFCLLISFAHHCYPDGGREVYDSGGIVCDSWKTERERDPLSPVSVLAFSPLTLPVPRLAVLYGTVHYFSTVYTQPLDPLWLMDCSQRFSLFDSTLHDFNLPLSLGSFRSNEIVLLKFRVDLLLLTFRFSGDSRVRWQIRSLSTIPRLNSLINLILNDR